MTGTTRTIGTDGGFSGGALPLPETVTALTGQDIDAVAFALACTMAGAFEAGEHELGERTQRALEKFQVLRRHARQHGGQDAPEPEPLGAQTPMPTPPGDDVEDDFEGGSLQDWVDRWHQGRLTDAELAQGVGLMVDGVNAAFDFLRSETSGAIDAHASVRIQLPRKESRP